MLTIIDAPAPRPEKKQRWTKGKNAPPWERIFTEYLIDGMQEDRRPSPNIYRILADKYGLNHGSVRNRASQERWSEALKDRLAERSRMRDELVQCISVANDVQVRIKQAECARAAINLALKKIQATDPADLSVKEATALLRLGLQEERRALGLETVITLDPSKIKNDRSEGAVKAALSIIDSLAQRQPGVKGMPPSLEGDFSVESD